MNLYYALTVFHQLECILHKLIINPNEPAHLYISSSMIQEEGQLDRLKACGLFEEVLIMDDAKTWGIGSKVKVNKQELFDEVLEEISNVCFESLIMPLEDYEKFYIFADHFPFGFVLAYKDVPYYYFEEATGAHSRRSILLEEIRHKNEFWYLVFERLGARGEAECIIEKNIDFDFQIEGFSDPKAVDFSVRKMLQRLNREQMALVLSVFGQFSDLELDTDKKLALVLTQHYAAASITTFEGQRLLYALMMDFFAEGMQVIIKPHPTDRQGVYSKWFQNAKKLERQMPSELLSYCFPKQLELVISATSSSAYNLKSISNHVMTFESEDNRFDKLFYFMDRYYVVAKYVKQLGENYEIYSIGADTRQLDNFFEQYNLLNKITELNTLETVKNNQKKIYVIDNLELCGVRSSEMQMRQFMNKVGEEDIIFFINSDNAARFVDPMDNNWALHTAPICIDKMAISDECLMKPGREWIYLYSKNNDRKREALTLKIDKMLFNTGIEIKVNDIQNEMKLSVLEGTLKATEQKCIRMSEELRQARMEVGKK